MLRGDGSPLEGHRLHEPGCRTALIAEQPGTLLLLPYNVCTASMCAREQLRSLAALTAWT